MKISVNSLFFALLCTIALGGVVVKYLNRHMIRGTPNNVLYGNGSNLNINIKQDVPVVRLEEGGGQKK